MVKPFQFSKLPEIIFGNGKIAMLPEMIMHYGNKFVLVTGQSSFTDSASGKSLLASLQEKSINFDLIKVGSEPSPEFIDDSVIRLKESHADVVVAVGGGSVMDAGKAISAMLTVGVPVADFLEGVGTRIHPGTKIPFIAVPTTSGTGSEATKNAVISQVGKDGFKKSLRHENFVPDIALVDPGLTLDCPPELTSASGMDCFTQLTEAFLSDKANEFSDSFAIEGLKAIKVSLIKSYIDGQDIEARSGMSFAALTSGICLANAGLGVVHGFASSIGGKYRIPHGIICGTLMAASNKITVRKLRSGSGDQNALKRYVFLGKLFLGEKKKSDNYFIDGFLGFLHDLTERLNLPVLKNEGVMEEDLKELCLITECKNNPVKLDAGELMEILKMRFC